MQLSLILLFLQLWGNVEVSLSQNACPNLPEVPHASVSEVTKKAVYHQGSVIQFVCEIGYTSFPPIKYACTENGWLPLSRGRCILKPCVFPDDTPNGYYQIIHGEEFVFGTTVKYFCNEGYQMVSMEDTRTCMLDKWSNRVPICDRLSCDPPSADGGLTVKGLPDNDDPILPDRLLIFSCEGPGKYLNGSRVLRCGQDGQWDHPFPTCENVTRHEEGCRLNCNAEKCKVPRLSDGLQLPTYEQRDQLRTGEKLTFTCRRRGDFLRGKAEVECLAGGRWSDPFPTCGAPLGCGTPPYLADADTRGALKFQYRHGETVEYICQNYYRKEGETYKTCINGEWIGQMRCLKPCTVDRELMNRYNIAFRYGYSDKLYSPHDDTIEFTCTKGRHTGTLSMRQKCIDGVMNLPTCQ